MVKRAGSARKSFGTALRAAVGYARETNGTHVQCVEMAALARRYAQTRLTGRPRSGLELYGAEPVTQAARGVSPCASQARLGLWGRHLGEGHCGLASVANVRVTAGDEKLLSLVTFLPAEKKVPPAPGRGSANRPPRNRDSTKAH